MSSTFVAPAGEHPDAEAGLWSAWADDGRPLLAAGSLALVASGLFAWFLAATDQLLPHDLDWLTISEAELRAVADGRLVHFMSHDRGAFGGTLISIGVLYLWLIRFPLGAARPWAWWVLAGSAGVGALTFMSYLATGYLDSWHGLATLAILPLFVVGLWRTRGAVAGGPGQRQGDGRHSHPPLLRHRNARAGKAGGSICPRPPASAGRPHHLHRRLRRAVGRAERLGALAVDGD